MDTQDWQEQLIALYCFISEQYREHLWMHVERLSPNCHPRFRDEEVLTVYLFGLLQQMPSLKAIHRYTRSHLGAWFPALPSYAAFVHRLGRLDAALPAFVRTLVESRPRREVCSGMYLIDSMPIFLAQGVRADRARIASGAADLGYCASKKTFYYGIKLHLVACHAPHALPRPEGIFFSQASASDLTVAKSYSGALPSGELYADKIYHDNTWTKELRERAIELHASLRRARGQEPLDAADTLYNTFVSRIRQPIESFFAWLQQKTQIQNASRVRSTSGLWVHAFGRLAAALLPLCLNP